MSSGAGRRRPAGAAVSSRCLKCATATPYPHDFCAEHQPRALHRCRYDDCDRMVLPAGWPCQVCQERDERRIRLGGDVGQEVADG